MMHKTWSSIEEVPYCFSRSSLKFQSYTPKKSSIWTQIGRLQTVTPVWIHQWLRNDAKRIEEVPYCFFGVIHQISRLHGLKNRRFELSKIIRPVAAIKSLRFALLFFKHIFSNNLFEINRPEFSTHSMKLLISVYWFRNWCMDIGLWGKIEVYSRREFIYS